MQSLFLWKKVFSNFYKLSEGFTRGCTHCTAAPAHELCLCTVCALLLLFIGPTLHLWFLKKRNPKGKVFCKFDKPSEEFTRGYTHCAAPGHELCLSAVCVLFYYSWGLFAIYDFSKKNPKQKVFCKFDKPSEGFTRGCTHCAAPAHELCLSAVCAFFALEQWSANFRERKRVLQVSFAPHFSRYCHYSNPQVQCRIFMQMAFLFNYSLCHGRRKVYRVKH